MVKKKLPVRYNDQLLRILLCVIAAVLVALYGTGARYLDSLSQTPFFIKLLAAFLMACFFIEFVHQVTVQLDKVFDWMERPLIRLVLQFALGMLLPGIIDLLFLSIYRWYFGIHNTQTDAGTHGSFPVMALPVFLFNIYYLFYYHILRKREEKQSANRGRQNLLVQQGSKTIPVPVRDIRYIYHRDRINYLVTADQTRYFLQETLEELELKLPTEDFFRINRKMIIHHSSCLHFSSNGHGKLLLDLDPRFPEEATVSQSRTAKFKEWIRR